MDIDREKLPNDLAALRQMVVGLLEEAEARERRLRQLQHWVEQLLRARYGPRRERVDENQLFLFAVGLASRGQAPASSSTSEEMPPAGEGAGAQRAKPQGHGRQRLPETLERRQVIYDLPEQERQCPQCQAELKRIGEEISERLEYVPASFSVIEEICPKYACAKGCTVVTAAKPVQPIEKGLPGPGMLAQVAVSKYGDHLPLHRQEAIYQRQGVELSRQTMCDWMRRGAELVTPSTN
jgi:transposase